MLAPKRKQEVGIQQDDIIIKPETVSVNPIAAMYYATKKVLSKLTVDPDNSNSPPLFRTIKLDKGQFERIVRSKINTESGIAFPAVFIHFTNIRFLVQQQRIGEGRATMRVRFVLNRLNDSDSEFECEGFEIAERINIAIQDAKDKEPALNERCNLTYIDQPSTMTKGLQAFWIDYEVWFRDTSAYKYRNWLKRSVVIPPFANHKDQDPENNTNDHEDHGSPTYNEVSTITKPKSPEIVADDSIIYDIDGNIIVDKRGNKIKTI